jgi:hypothetical protein
MARQTGNMSYKGTMGGIRHYTMEGSEGVIAATKGVVPKTILDKSPVFEGSRKARFEFKAKTKLATEIRRALGEWSKPIVDRLLHSKMVSVMNHIIEMDDRMKFGHRDIYLSRYKEMLYQIPTYYYYKPLSEILRCPYTMVENGERNSVTLVVKGLFPLRHIKAPDKASHFQLYLSIGCVKDCIYDEEFHFYKSYSFRKEWFVKETHSEWIPINETLMDDLTLTVSLPETHELTDSETVIRSFGIVFGQMTSQVEPLKRDRGSIVFLGAV